MSSEWTYQVELRHEAGEIHAYCRDVPEAIAAGTSEADALHEMGQAIAAAVRGRMKDNMEIEAPRLTEGRSPRVTLPLRLAAKAAIYSAWRRSGLSKVALGAKIGRSETEVRRILDPDYGTKLDQLEVVAAGLGGRLALSFMAEPDLRP